MPFLSRNTVLAVFLSIPFLLIDLPAQAQTSATPLTLRSAILSTMANNPQLSGYKFQLEALEGERQSAALKPEYSVSADMENVLGTGDFSGVDGAEVTLSLSSLLEYGSKRESRLAVVDANRQQLDAEQRVLLLDVLTDMTRQFIAVAASQSQLSLQQQVQQQAEKNLRAISDLVAVGRIGDAEQLRAKAALANATINLHKAEQQLSIDRLQLSAYWVESSPSFNEVQANLADLPEPAALDVLQNQLQKNPDLAVLASNIAMRDAEIQQARQTGKRDIGWSAGIRNMQETNDSAFLFGMEIPLGTSQRATGAIAKASAERQLAENRQQVALQLLSAQLRGMRESYQQARSEIQGLQQDVIPLYQSALKNIQKGFSEGRYGYFELSLAQQDLLEVQQSLIEATVNAQLVRIQIERITGTALDAYAIEVTP